MGGGRFCGRGGSCTLPTSSVTTRRQRHRRRGLPIAVGVGLSIQLRGTDQVVMVIFGDGASNEGAFHESLNMASIWRLPVVYLCENNQYGMSMPVARR